MLQMLMNVSYLIFHIILLMLSAYFHILSQHFEILEKFPVRKTLNSSNFQTLLNQFQDSTDPERILNHFENY